MPIEFLNKLKIEPWDSDKVNILKKSGISIKHRVLSRKQSEENALYWAINFPNIPEYRYENDSYAEWVRNDAKVTKQIRAKAESMGLFCEIMAY